MESRAGVVLAAVAEGLGNVSRDALVGCDGRGEQAHGGSNLHLARLFIRAAAEHLPNKAILLWKGHKEPTDVYTGAAAEGGQACIGARLMPVSGKAGVFVR